MKRTPHMQVKFPSRDLIALSSHRMSSMRKVRLWPRTQDCLLFSFTWWQLSQDWCPHCCTCVYARLFGSSLTCIILLVPRCSVPGAAAGDRTWPGKPSQILSVTSAVSGFSITSSGGCWHWICQPTGKGQKWMWYVHFEAALTVAHPSRATSPSPEICPRISCLGSWGLCPQRTQPCISVKDTVMEPQCEPRHKHSCRDTQDYQRS
jgi:hypothetical protein